MTPAFIKVLIDGQETPAELDTLDCTVTHELNRHSTCSVQFREPPATRFFFEQFIGKPMEIKAVDVDGAELRLFKGLMQQADADWELNGSAILTFTGITKSYTLDTFERSQTFNQVTPMDAFQRLLNGLEGTLVAANEDPISMIQYAETDWSYLFRLADRFGEFLRVNGDSIDIFDQFQDNGLQVPWRTENGLRKFKTTGRLQPHLYFGVSFESGTATSEQTDMVMEEVPAESSLPDLRNGAIEGSGNLGLTSGLWDRFLARNNRNFLSKLSTEAQRLIMSTCRGFGESRIPEITVGEKIEITGDLDTPGKYGVIQIKHNWRPFRGYQNEFVCSPFKHYMEPVRPTSERHYGPEVARVAETSSPGDPRSTNVRVNFTWEQHGDTGFLPLLTPNAGADRGICFVPEVGDQVLVLFRGGDSNRPIVLGSLWNGVDTAPLEDLHGGEYTPNDIKRIVTKSGNRLIFDDKPGKETMVMATPNHVRVSLFDGGQTLLLHSDGDIKIHAGGTVHMKCNQFLREVG